jgi:hypothetical protein
MGHGAKKNVSYEVHPTTDHKCEKGIREVPIYFFHIYIQKCLRIEKYVI